MAPPETPHGQDEDNHDRKPALYQEHFHGTYYRVDITYDFNQPAQDVHPAIDRAGIMFPVITSYPTTEVTTYDLSSQRVIDVSVLLPADYHIAVVRIDPSYLKDMQQEIPGLDEKHIADLMHIFPIPEQHRIAVPIYGFRNKQNIDRNAELLIATIGSVLAYPNRFDWDRYNMQIYRQGQRFLQQVLGRKPRVLGK